ncbi:hypothetical protein [Micromonospora sp. ATA51]|uniref:hypothetical protein n=1 Tax=Micromonospora sp. ATA51 TaxID=2806098 RepID=UPI001A4D367F|nr:hypothetical protein [Micromonospora sp. ATA51]MBM0230298.1 hypothetical protein [Micromonospora sp. ATA51]
MRAGASTSGVAALSVGVPADSGTPGSRVSTSAAGIAVPADCAVLAVPAEGADAAVSTEESAVAVPGLGAVTWVEGRGVAVSSGATSVEGSGVAVPGVGAVTWLDGPGSAVPGVGAAGAGVTVPAAVVAARVACGVVVRPAATTSTAEMRLADESGAGAGRLWVGSSASRSITGPAPIVAA